MGNEIIYNTLASIYSLPELNVSSFDISPFLDRPYGQAALIIFSSFKVVGVILSIVLFVLFVINFIKTERFLKMRANLLKTMAPLETAQSTPLGSRWEEIQKHLNSTKEAEWKFAVIEADSLVDFLLKSAGYPGDTMGERLKNIDKTQIVSIDGLWEAHKIRNRLAHDPSYFLRYGEAKRAIQFYEKTLKELNAL